MPSQTTINVFGYLDYRELLRAYYDLKKAEGRGFSYRAFARRAKMRSPNHLKRVIDGERALTTSMASRYAAACDFSPEETLYFCDLVAFNEAKTLDERNLYFDRLAGFQQYRKARKLELAHAAYHAKWYLPAVRELVLRKDFKDDPAWIARELVPPISPSEAASCLKTLLELGLLVRKNDRLVQADAIVSTGPETEGLHIANYHRSMMERAMGAIDLVCAQERDISSVTMCLPLSTLHDFKRRIQAFRRELVSSAAKHTQGDVVVQLNMQLFPLSRPNKDLQ